MRVLFFSFLSDDPSLLGRSDGHDGWRRPAGGRETDLPDPDPDPDPVTVTETETETVTARSRWWLQCALRLWWWWPDGDGLHAVEEEEGGRQREDEGARAGGVHRQRCPEAVRA